MTIKLRREADLRNMTFVEKVKFYTSLCLGTTALLSVFAFLFLLPFVVDPSITTIMANFDTEPVVCITAGHVYMEGLSNCTWTSCKEGCTSVTPRCHQIYVNYSALFFRHFIEVNFFTHRFLAFLRTSIVRMRICVIRFVGSATLGRCQMGVGARQIFHQYGRLRLSTSYQLYRIC